MTYDEAVAVVQLMGMRVEGLREMPRRHAFYIDVWYDCGDDGEDRWMDMYMMPSPEIAEQMFIRWVEHGAHKGIVYSDEAQRDQGKRWFEPLLK